MAIINPKHKSLFSSAQWSILITLAILMVLTRSSHFANTINLPSASLACFFIAGLFIKRTSSFTALFTLSIGIDLISSYARGSFGSCITVSYPFLIIGYFAVFKAATLLTLKTGNKAKTTSVKTLITLFIASSFAFLTSNASYYLFSGKFTDLSWMQYSGRVGQYYLPYIQSPFIYVVAALAIYFVVNPLSFLKKSEIKAD